MSELVGLTNAQRDLVLLEGVRAYEALFRNRSGELGEFTEEDAKADAWLLDPDKFPAPRQRAWEKEFGHLKPANYNLSDVSLFRDERGYQLLSRNPPLMKQISNSQLEDVNVVKTEYVEIGTGCGGKQRFKITTKNGVEHATPLL